MFRFGKGSGWTANVKFLQRILAYKGALIKLKGLAGKFSTVSIAHRTNNKGWGFHLAFTCNYSNNILFDHFFCIIVFKVLLPTPGKQFIFYSVVCKIRVTFKTLSKQIFCKKLRFLKYCDNVWIFFSVKIIVTKFSSFIFRIFLQIMITEIFIWNNCNEIIVEVTTSGALSFWLPIRSI